jgi:hypothetical protein
MNVKHFTFEGRPMTVPEIMRLVPVLTERSVRRFLDQGRDTRQAMLCVDSSLGRRKGGQHTSARKRAWGHA